MRSSLINSSTLAAAQQVFEFVSNVLESSTEYSVSVWREEINRGYRSSEYII